MTKEQLIEMFNSWSKRIGYGCSESDVAALANAIAMLELAEAIRGRA